MWKRKELKQKARTVIKKNYWAAIVVCFLMALLTNEFGPSIIGIWHSNDSIDPNYIVNESSDINEYINENENGFLRKFEDKIQVFQEKSPQLYQVIEANLNNIIKYQKYLLKIWDATQSFTMEQNTLGILLCIGAVIAILFIIFIANPIIVGGKRYFIKVTKNDKTKIGTMVDVFKNKNLLNVSMIMLLRGIYNLLWFLTIIGGVIKFYEYRMIPYILAENPKVQRKQAFKLSKQMMKGNKWNTFILDLSFILWEIASLCTFGLLNILYVNPYNSATLAELYITLRKKVIKEKEEDFEVLNDVDLNK